MKHGLTLVAVIVAIVIGAGALGFYFGHPSSASTPGSDTAAVNARVAATDLLQLTVATPDGKATSLRQWQGKVLVLNFWATWCPPCREEMPEFSRMQKKLADKGVQFVGIGIDTPDNILNFEKTNPVSYPLLLGSYDMLKLTADLGNSASALPFTVILDRNGHIAHTKIGKLSVAEMEQLLPPLYSAPVQ